MRSRYDSFDYRRPHQLLKFGTRSGTTKVQLYAEGAADADGADRKTYEIPKKIEHRL